MNYLIKLFPKDELSARAERKQFSLKNKSFMHPPQSQWPGLVMALVSAILFSTLAIFIKLAYQQHLTVNAIVVLRMSFASIFPRRRGSLC